MIELLVAVSLVALLAVTVLGAFTVGHRSVKGMAQGLDANQQLRAAVKMMTDDLNWAKWWTGTGERSSIGCYVADGMDSLVNGCDFFVKVDQPKADRSHSDWTLLPDWPGDLNSYATLRIRYRLVEGDLVREVLDDSNTARVYSSQVLLSGIIPYDGSENGSRFELRNGANGLVQVVLRMPVTAGGSTDVAQVSTVFYIR